MPTGYTASITEGDGVTFPEFALTCARAFGALITMRDAAPDAPIPDSFPADTYHQRAHDEALAFLIDLSNMTDDDCRREANTEYLNALKSHRERLVTQERNKARYEAMLDQALAWEPPSEDHVEMKAFMVQQIEESLRFGVGYAWPEPVRLTPAQWRTEKRTKAERDVAYHAEKQSADEERAEQRTRWTQQLKASLGEQRG